MLGLAADAVNMVILDWLIGKGCGVEWGGQEGELGLLCWSWFLAGPATHSLCALPQAAASAAPLLAFSPNFSEPLRKERNKGCAWFLSLAWRIAEVSTGHFRAKSVASDTWGGGPDPAMARQRVSGPGISPSPGPHVPEHTGDEVGAARGPLDPF